MIRDRRRNSTWPRIYQVIVPLSSPQKKETSWKNEPARDARWKIDDTRPAVAICAFCARRCVRRMYSYASRIDRATQLHDAESARIIWRRARPRGIVGARGSSASFSSRLALVSPRYFSASSRPRIGSSKRDPSADERPWRGHGVPVALAAPPCRGRRAERQRCGVAWLGASDRSACVFVVLREYLRRVLNCSYSPLRARGLTSEARGGQKYTRRNGEERAWTRERERVRESDRGGASEKGSTRR